MKLVCRGVKTLLNSTFVFLSFTSISQTGLSRLDAIQIQPQGLCSYSDFTTTGTEMWFKFVAQSQKVAIEMQSEKYGNNQAHIHNLKLYRNTETTEMAQDELPFNAESKKLKINLNAGNLTPGETYYLRADRKPRVHECKKEYCHENGSLNPAQLRLCVMNLDVYIPVDFNGEKPNNSFGYELNRGQLFATDKTVLNEIVMYTQHSTPQVFLGNTYTSFLWAKSDGDTITPDTLHRVDMEFVGGALNEQVLKAEELAGHSNYFLGDNEILATKSYSRAVRQNVYNDVDLHHYSNENGLKMYFVVNENANPQDIRFRFTGGVTTELTANEGLRLKSPIGEMTFKKALVYYVNPAGQNVPMPQSGRIIESSTGVYGVEVVETYPPKRKLIIQLEQEVPKRGLGDAEWCTYFGGTGIDDAKDMDMDNQNNLYVTGKTSSADFPAFGAGIYQFELDGNTNGYIAKFDQLYQQMWTTYVGGAEQGIVNLSGISIDNLNQVLYVSGSMFQAALPPFPLAGSPNCYVDGTIAPFLEKSVFARFDNELGNIEWLTLFPGDKFGEKKIKVDDEGNVYCVGLTSSFATTYPVAPETCLPTADGNFPMCNTTPNAYKQFRSAKRDIYIAKFNPLLELVWSTHFGGSEEDFISDIAIDNEHDFLYLAGWTKSTQSLDNCLAENTSGNFPLCRPNLDGFYYSKIVGVEGFLTRFSLDGVMNWSTYYGGSTDDLITGIDLDLQGNIIIVGETETFFDGTPLCETPTNGGLPTCHTGTAYQQAHPPGYFSDAFVAKFDYQTRDLLWASRIGGPGTEKGSGSPKVEVNTQNKIFVFGSTTSGSNIENQDFWGSFPTLNHSTYYYESGHQDYDEEATLQADMFVMGFENNGELFWSTYFGGTGSNGFGKNDYAGEIISNNENVFICGITQSDLNFPVNKPNTPNPYFQGQFSGGLGTDAFIAQVSLDKTVQVKENKFNTKLNSTIFPNPNDGNFVVNWCASSSGNMEIKLYNQTGQVLDTKIVSAKEGNNTLEMNYNHLSSGIYFVTLENGNFTKTHKLVLQ